MPVEFEERPCPTSSSRAVPSIARCYRGRHLNCSVPAYPPRSCPRRCPHRRRRRRCHRRRHRAIPFLDSRQIPTRRLLTDDGPIPRTWSSTLRDPPANLELNPEQPSEQPRARGRGRVRGRGRSQQAQQADDLWAFDYYDNGGLPRNSSSSINVTFISLTSDSSSGNSSRKSSVASADGELDEQHGKQDQHPVPAVEGHSDNSHALQHTGGVMNDILSECASNEWGFSRASVYDSCEEGEEACAFDPFDPMPTAGPYEEGEGEGEGECGGRVEEEEGGLSGLINRLVFGCVPTAEMMTHHESFLVEEGDEGEGQGDATDGCEHHNPGGEGYTCRHSEGSTCSVDGNDDAPCRRRLGSHENSLPTWERDTLNPRTRAEQDYRGRMCAKCQSSVTTAAKVHPNTSTNTTTFKSSCQRTSGVTARAHAHPHPHTHPPAAICLPTYT